MKKIKVGRKVKVKCSESWANGKTGKIVEKARAKDVGFQGRHWIYMVEVDGQNIALLRNEFSLTT